MNDVENLIAQAQEWRKWHPGSDATEIVTALILVTEEQQSRIRDLETDRDPAKVSFRMLGLDLGPLIDKVTDAILIEFLPGYTERVKAEAWNERAAAHRKGIVTTEWHKWPANPYRRES